ncbi:hypothetical protein LLCRE1631_02450 [Lactococcus lactis subsp. lactis CNCM I-1631]|nr:hypothetical protein LLCRE1631_02450 [Lactococcus lactis subsp. lactis CNCM I-1631]
MSFIRKAFPAFVLSENNVLFFNRGVQAERQKQTGNLELVAHFCYTKALKHK